MSSLQSGLLERAPGVRHGFFTRRGGVSQGEFEALNCSLSSGDSEQALHENRRRVTARLGLEEGGLVTLTQVHSRRVWRVEDPMDFAPAREGDGLVSRRPGVGLGLLSADCAPLLFADAGAGVIGAAHAGWKGALHGVTDEVLDRMAELGAKRSRIIAAIGPCIQRDSYQVDAAFVECFAARSPL
ncbi:MAG: polyphenol oxidase family protein, partial [Pseudomonadota bacterium]|nr:polyphenol oxidase family protein [Pseudomonadota bacterium]